LLSLAETTQPLRATCSWTRERRPWRIPSCQLEWRPSISKNFWFHNHVTPPSRIVLTYLGVSVWLIFTCVQAVRMGYDCLFTSSDTFVCLLGRLHWVKALNMWGLSKFVF
jgi:hypothetical protein